MLRKYPVLVQPERSGVLPRSVETTVFADRPEATVGPAKGAPGPWPRGHILSPSPRQTCLGLVF